MRAEGDHTPVLFLTARDGTEDKVRGLTLGGDDYLVKPFSLEELVARCQALVRRAGLARDDDSVLRCADLQMDDGAHRVWRAGQRSAEHTSELQSLMRISYAVFCLNKRQKYTNDT